MKKLEPHTYIGYLVRYDSTNIFRIWISSKQKVISTHNVTFNETQFYNSKISNAIQLNQLSEQILEVIEMPELLRLSNSKLVSKNNDEEELNAKKNQNKQHEQQTSEYVCHLENLYAENLAEPSDAVIHRLPTP